MEVRGYLSDVNLNKYENFSKVNMSNRIEPKGGQSTNTYIMKKQTINYAEPRQDHKASDLSNLVYSDINTPLTSREADNYKSLAAYPVSQKNTQQKGNSNPLKYLVQAKTSSTDPHDDFTPRGTYVF